MSTATTSPMAPAPTPSTPPMPAGSAAAGKSRKLHLGCGLVTPATWLNVDGSLNARLGKYPFVRSVAKAVGLTDSKAQFDKSVYGHDLRKPLPWSAASFSGIYASHLFEHMYVDEVQRLMKECLRVLEPGGALRVVVPDLAVLIQGYVTGKFPTWTQDHIKDAPRADMFITGILMRDPAAPAGGLLKRVYQSMFDFHSHKWMYDGASMTQRFIDAGFKDVRVMGYGESRIDGILDVEREIRVKDGAGVVVEGVKG